MSAAVIDASAALAWLFGEETDGAWLDRFGATASFVAPWLWRIEVVNAILVKERRSHITRAQASRFFQSIEVLDIQLTPDPTNRSMEQLASFARPHQLSAYDAIYLELALTRNLPLVTFDRNLRQAAEKSGVAILP